MTLKLYIGSAAEITARLAGAPSSTTTTVATVTSTTVFTLTSATTFSTGQSIVINQQKVVIDDLTGTTVTLAEALDALPTVGDTVRHYNADFSKYRNPKNPFTMTNDLKTGGNTGGAIGQDLIVNDWDFIMPRPKTGNRVLIFDDQATDTVLFSGTIAIIKTAMLGRNAAGTLVNDYILTCRGYQLEGDAVGIEEEPQVNINAGDFLEYLLNKYTTLTVGEIDTDNSPNIDYIRLGNFRRFSDVGRDLSALWADSEFYVDNGQTGGVVYFRKAVTTDAPITLNTAFLKAKGTKNVVITENMDKVYNIVRLPFYVKQRRAPDFFVQDTVADSAFLRSTVQLSGIPANLEESMLILDDFKDGEMAEQWVEDDITNPSPPTDYIGSDGFLIEGPINDVDGFHLYPPGATTLKWSQVARQTDPAVIEPFTGEERQTMTVQELVVNTAGDAVFGGIMDQTTRTTTTVAGSTATIIKVASNTYFQADDQLTVGAEAAFVSSVSGTDTITLTGALAGGAPSAGVTVTLHRAAKSRVLFGISLKAAGSIKILKSGTESNPSSGAQSYTAGPTTYSFRTFMQCFETTLASSVTALGATLTSATNVAVGDVVEIFSQGDRVEPEQRVILTKAGSDVTWAALDNTPSVGYRLRTLPKIQVQVKGGTFGTITDRVWTTIHQETNTWQTAADTSRGSFGVLLAMHKTFVGTITQFIMRDPPYITAMLGTRFLHLATQEVETSEPDIDAIVSKIGSHVALNFFPDTKEYWSTGLTKSVSPTLRLDYFEKLRYELEDHDLDSMREVARLRGQTLTGTESEDELKRKGGKAMDTIQILPSPLTLAEGSEQSRGLLDALKDLAYIAEIQTNTLSDELVKPGQIIRSELPNVPDLTVQRVEITEIPGANDPTTDKALFFMKVIAGSVDRLSDILLKRETKNQSRVVIDDGRSDDTLTKISKYNLNESMTMTDTFTVYTCTGGGTARIYASGAYTSLKCLRMPV